MDEWLVYLKDSKSLQDVPAAVDLLRRHGMRPVTTVPPGEKGRVVAIVAGLGRFAQSDADGFPTLRTVARFGAGYDNVDVNGLWAARRIAVSYTPDISTVEVAELALAMMILTLRGAPRDIAGLSSESSRWRVIGRGLSLSEATVGIVGCGRIGLEAARLAAPLAAKTLLWNRSQRRFSLAGVDETRYEHVRDLDELAARADVVSIHLALTPESTGIVGAAFFEKLRVAGRSIALVNTARGNVVDERALLDALNANIVRAAAVDVWSVEGPIAANEPRTDRQCEMDTVGLIRRHPAVLPTSHIGAFTRGVLHRCAMQCAHNIVAVVEKKEGESAGFIADPARILGN
jgi:phosphoglycerate dehydrogenase-like enzyme